MARPGQRVTGKGGGVGSNQYARRGVGKGKGKRAVATKPETKATLTIARRQPSVGNEQRDFSNAFGPDGNLIDGHIAGFPVTRTHEGNLEKISKKTKAALEDAMSDPAIVEALKVGRIKTIQFAPTTFPNAPKGWSAAHTGNSIIIHPKTAEAIEKSAVGERSQYGLKRVIHHEVGHAIWEATPDTTKTQFAVAIKHHPEVTDHISRIVNVAARPDSFSNTGSRLVTESFAEISAIRRYDQKRYAELPDSIRKPIEDAYTNSERFIKTHHLSIDAIPTLNINRPLNPNSSPTPPDIPDADEIAEQTIGYLEELYREIEERLLAGQPIGDLAAKLDRLVAQTDLSGWIAGAVGVWHDSKKPRLYTLDALGGVPTRRFPWIEEAARWLMDREVYSAQEIQAQARGEFEPRWKSLEAVTLVRNEIANGFVVGETFEEFHKRIRDKVAATKPELQNAFRTATHQAYIVGTTNTLEKPLVKLQFPFVQYRSAHDVRTRATHRELDGLLFAVGSAEYDLMRRALNDFNCRCAITSLTEKEATRKKLKPVTMAELPREVVAKYGR